MEKPSLRTRFKNSWNAFFNKDPTPIPYGSMGVSSGYSPLRSHAFRGGDKSIMTSILNRIAVDTAFMTYEHIKVDENGDYVKTMDSGLNRILTTEANIDQNKFQFMFDIAWSLLDDGCIAVAPIDTNRDPQDGSFDIYTARTAKIVEWFPQNVRVHAYNEITGNYEDVLIAKRNIAIIENPFYPIMNERDSTRQRLMKLYRTLDETNGKIGSERLDLIIQLPYQARTDSRRAQAETRRKDIEDQLANSKYGVAYTDGTEKITQLNRPVENQLMAQIEYLQNMLFSQLGMTQGILDGTADEQTMTNYYTRTVKPVVDVITAEFTRKFLTETARTQGQIIRAYRDPFALVPVNNVAEIADKFTRNEIMTSNEIRSKVGLKPSKDPKADRLENSNLNHDGQEEPFDPNSEINEE